MKTYFYSIGYYSCEESRYEQLSHTKKFSHQQITKMIAEGCIALWPKREHVDALKFQDLMSDFDKMDIIAWLIKNKGFKKVKQTTWSCFGWADVMNKGSWEEERGELDDDLCDAITKLGGLK